MKNDKIKTKDTIKTQSIGRPKKELDKDVIAKLSQIGCTQEEIGSKTICRFSKRKQKHW